MHSQPVRQPNSLQLPAIICMVCCLVMGYLDLSRATAGELNEYAVKTALVLNLAIFTEWPESVYTETPDTITLCVMGDNVVREAFARIAGRNVGARMLQIRNIHRFTSIDDCQVIFMGGQDRFQLSRMHAETEGKPILTVDDINGIHAFKSIVNIQPVSRKMQITINIDLAKKARLKVSSRLLKLARIVSTELDEKN